MKRQIGLSRLGKSAALPIICAAVLASASYAAPRRESVALTVYNQNLALVKDVRALDLERGSPEVRIDDVAAFIDPTSVHFAALDHPDAVAVVEQNYQYDVADADRLLSRYLNRPVTVTMKEGGNRDGTLLSFDGASLVLQEGKGAVVVNRAEVRDVMLGEVPGGLVVKPTLFWRLASERTGSERVEVSYLTNGINWHAEYVAVVNAKDDALTLNGWVSLDNQSGATYENAKLKLVAGDVHRVTPPPMPIPMDAYREKAALGVAAPQFAERGFFEYHIYTLERPATVADKETKQIALFPSASAAAKKLLTYDGARDGNNVAIRMEFENSKKNNLGMALPAGKVRVYKEDVDEALEFVGEDLIDHTPRDEKVRVYLGNAFDVVGERTQTSYKQTSTRSHEESYAIEIRNHKDESINVTIIEHLQGDWRINEKSHDFVKKDARTAEFNVNVPANGSVKVTYTARMNF